ncbi:MAG: GTPase ObgE [Myxococcales bacterium]|nr:GTPase ObgE [Myxococcales bacterium]
MKFIDQANISIRSGKGGHGSVHFRREKNVPRGGPDGGDGGRGGDVWIVATGRSRSLIDYHQRRLYAADDGQPGGEKGSSGRSGEPLELKVPLGTQLFDAEDGQLLADLLKEGDRHCVAKGGNGGWGNLRFKTATRQAPDRANPGQPATVRSLRMELKLLADIALVGLPNAGKSTLIRQVSASRARVADYPFTTLTPNLGVVRHRDVTFTIADVPGLIAGAADGAGLGHQFLRHIERCEALVFVLSATDAEPPAQALAVLRHELAQFDSSLATRPSRVVINKADVLGPDAAKEAQKLSRALGEPVLAISAVTGDGVTKLLDGLLPFVSKEAVKAPTPTWSPNS